MTRSAWWLAALALFFATLVLFAPICFQNRVLFFGDLGLYFIPMLDFQRGELLHGRIALWNPNLMCGSVVVGNPQAWPLYPFSALLFILTPERFVSLNAVIHTLLAALGMLLFLKQRGRDATAATFGAAAFAFGGAVISKAQFPNMLQAMAYLPWLLLTIERLLEKITVRRVGLLGITVGLTLLAAHAQVVMMQFYLCVAWLGFRVGQLPKPQRLRLVLWLACAAMLGVLLAMGQLLPMLQHVRDSTRPQLDLDSANRFYLPLTELLLFLRPNAYGNPADLEHPWTARGNFWEPCCYIGLVPLGLALIALRRRGEAGFWMLVSILSLWLALGKGGGLYTLAFYALPGVKQFHDPARFLYLTTFALANLAALGMGVLPVRFRWVTALIGVLEVVSFVYSLNPTTPAFVFDAARRTPIQSARVVHVDPYGGWGRYVLYRTYDSVDTETEVFGFLTSQTPNLSLLRNGGEINAYEPVARADFMAMLKEPNSGPELAAESMLKMTPDLVGAVATPFKDAKPRASLGEQALSIQTSSSQRVVIALPRTHAAGRVILRDTLAPGWRARVDGSAAEITPHFFVFRSVDVSENAQTVEFYFDPTAWRVGLFLSLVGGGILVGMLVRRESPT
jgi:hypothetical protein